MNVLVFLAGISVGWAADRLYNSYMANNAHDNEEEETKTEKNDTKKKDLTKNASAEQIRDDLGQLKGVGPKLAEALDAIGIYSYQQLSEQPVDILVARLQENGGRFTRPAIAVVVERAKQAAQAR